MQKIQLADAKARLSALVDAAAGGEPAIITRHGKAEAVILGYAEWQKLARVPSLVDLIVNAPFTDEDLPPRDTSPPRSVDF
jgi:prevent-host-death family protein